MCIPFLIWAAFRFGRRKAATATCVLAGIATWGTLHGFGPFSREARNTSLLLLQSFVGIVAVTSLALAAEISERKRADQPAPRGGKARRVRGTAGVRAHDGIERGSPCARQPRRSLSRYAAM